MRKQRMPSAKTAAHTHEEAEVTPEEEETAPTSSAFPFLRGPGSPSPLVFGFCETSPASLSTPLLDLVPYLSFFLFCNQSV